MSARDRRKHEAAQADRARIDALLRTRTQDQPLLVPREVLRILDWPNSKLRTIQRHFRKIRAAKKSVVQRHLSNDRVSI
jgi:hypothetical protein